MMDKPSPVQFAAESPWHRLLRVLQPGYVFALLRSRSRWVLAVMTLCVSFAIYWALQSPTYQARVVIHDEALCPHGYLKPVVIRSPSMGHEMCPHCKPKDGK